MRSLALIPTSVACTSADSRIDDPDLGRVEDREELGRAMAALSEQEREAVALRYGGDLTAPETAKLLGEKLTTVEGRLYRALRKLRAELD